ncbi:hypothetical protein [[Kitasatospora] papulosa]|uniref:hypothetical protein n=1 Tax=[Kitasatospora] papulosa TaxID=1464011 RepID=UPI00368CCF5A
MTSALADGLRLSDPAGNAVTIPPAAVARLWAAVADDRKALSLYGLGEPGDLAFALESTADDAPVVSVRGVLRYLLDVDDDALLRLCTTPNCPNESTGSSALTRVCSGHLDTVVPGLLPNAGDDILPGDREDAARESRTMRLNAWEGELRDAERHVAGELRVLETLRNGS